ncbi:MAG: DUF6282 family protein [Dehalococcoidales bacterium]|nr:DUF6282 family protein [Dehalococcoidales bacterium]
MQIEDELLRGAIDLHSHAWPEFSLRMRGRVDDIEWAQLAQAAGMRALVMKSMVFPTMERAYLVNRVVPGIKVFGSITLNTNLGGLSPFAVETAGELGAKVVWMPTWSSRNDLVKGGLFMARMKRVISTMDSVAPSPEAGITVLDSHGHLLPVVAQILEIIKKYDMVLATGHLSIEESLVLCRAAANKGIRFMLTHALNNRVNATIDQQKEIAGLGGFIEHCYITTMPMHQRLELKQVVEHIKAVGPEHVVITTDANAAWNAPPPELMRMFIGSLLQLGIDEAGIKAMAQTNPARLLGLPPEEPKSN